MSSHSNARSKAILCCALAALTGAVAAPAEWAQFRGPNASGTSEDTNLPTEFGPEKSVVWKTALPPGHSSPSIAGDKIFVTGFEGDELFTIALERNSGKILWRRSAPAPEQVLERPAKTHVGDSGERRP